jgi:UDP-glucose 4-epimerase
MEQTKKEKRLKRKWFPGIFDFINFKPKNPLLLKYVFYPPGMRFGLKMLAGMFKAANLPLLNRIHPWVKNEKNRLFIIPVQETLELGESVAVPYQLVETFIERSSYRVIIDFCACRKAGECKHYPSDLGCLILGEDSRRIPTTWARPASKEEAREHVQKGIKAGLPVFAGKPRVDNYIFGVPDMGRMFSVCFCCECCCLGNTINRYLPREKLKIQYNRLPGLEILVDPEKCTGCGTCVESCALGLIKMVDGKPLIPDYCQGCGRCAKYCPQKAIHLKLDNPAFLESAVKNLESVIKI